jgi:hypothetical protein
VLTAPGDDGTMILANGLGSVTVSLDRGPSPLVAGTSEVLHYTIIDATGAYRGDTGNCGST